MIPTRAGLGKIALLSPILVHRRALALDQRRALLATLLDYTPMRILTAVTATLFLALAFAACSGGSGQVLLGGTTSVQDTGLLDAIVQAFADQSGYDVKPVVAGSGQVLEIARRGEVDVILTHSPPDEQKLLDDGYALDRTPVMQNYFLVAGPPEDPAGVRSAADLTDAFRKLAAGRYGFVSRGDKSGTNVRELAIWKDAGIDPGGQSWYQESATGQGQNLLVASDKSAYTLVDSSTFAAFRARVHLEQLIIDRDHPNLYSVMRLNPAKNSKVNTKGGDAFLAFMKSDAGQALIADFSRDKYGAPLFEALHP